MLTIGLLFSLTFSFIRAERKCETFPNNKTNAFTYIACSGANVTNLDTSRAFCRKNFEGSDVVTFPNYEEYHFIVTSLNETMDEDFRYVPGFYQEKNESDRFSPETGKFFWISEPETEITNKSQTFWLPLRRLIVDFDRITALWMKQTQTFLLDLNGQMYFGVSLGGGRSFVPLNGGVICMKEGVPTLPTDGTMVNTTVVNTTVVNTTAGIATQLLQTTKTRYWIGISVGVAVLIVGILFASIAYYISKKTERQKKEPSDFTAI